MCQAVRLCDVCVCVGQLGMLAYMYQKVYSTRGLCFVQPHCALHINSNWTKRTRSARAFMFSGVIMHQRKFLALSRDHSGKVTEGTSQPP